VFGEEVVAKAGTLIMDRLEAEHAEDPLRSEVPLNRLRTALPQWAPGRLADSILERLAGEGRLELVGGGARRAGFVAAPTADQVRACAALVDAYREAGLAPATVLELPDALSAREDIWSLIRRLEGEGALTPIADGLYIDTGVLGQAIERVRSELGGRTGLGPSDFRSVLGVTRKHLIPLLNYFDGLGVTLVEDQVRSVPPL
jgi:selenocysteine-specific elongation factor